MQDLQCRLRRHTFLVPRCHDYGRRPCSRSRRIPSWEDQRLAIRCHHPHPSFRRAYQASWTVTDIARLRSRRSGIGHGHATSPPMAQAFSGPAKAMKPAWSASGKHGRSKRRKLATRNSPAQETGRLQTDNEAVNPLPSVIWDHGMIGAARLCRASQNRGPHGKRRQSERLGKWRHSFWSTEHGTAAGAGKPLSESSGRSGMKPTRSR